MNCPRCGGRCFPDLYGDMACICCGFQDYDVDLAWEIAAAEVGRRDRSGRHMRLTGPHRREKYDPDEFKRDWERRA